MILKKIFFSKSDKSTSPKQKHLKVGRCSAQQIEQKPQKLFLENQDRPKLASSTLHPDR